MPRKKGINIQRLQNLSSKGGAGQTAEQANLDVSSNRPINSGSNDTLHREEPAAYAHIPSSDTPESPDKLAENMNNLALEAQPGDDIVLEDPPNDDDEDSVDARNPSSLAEPEGDEAPELHLSNTEVLEDDIDEPSDPTKWRPIPRDEAKAMSDKLNAFIKSSFHGHGRARVSSLGEVVLTWVRFMVGTLNLIAGMDMTLTNASLTAAVVFGRGEWAARQVRKWIREYQKEGGLPTNVYGTWNESVMEDEDLSAAIRDWMRDKGKYVQARDIIDFFGVAGAERYSRLIDRAPSLRTAQRWMHRMGYSWMKERRGQFADGHERDDVKHYREHVYIPEWTRLERQMRSWDADGKEVAPELEEGERLVVVWFHDESTFYAHDRRTTRWVHEDETAGIYKKGEGVSLMVADFVSADYGWLRSRPESPGATEGEISTAQVVFRAGKQRDGWFGTVHVVQQLLRAMAIVKKQYPNEDHVFVFDNATIHTKLPENLPNVSKMTLGPSQKVGGEEIGPSGEKIKINFAPATLPDGTTQQLYHPSDHPIEKLRGAFKGMATILEERNVPNARKLKLVCAATDDNKQGCLPGSTNCCARRTMMNQPDILAQKSIIQTLAEAEGFSVLYLPKYHCELNPIEQCWGAAKRVYRDSPFSSLEADLKRNMLTALDSVKLESIRRFAARSQRFVHAYLAGLSGSQAAWAMKKFRGHRIIPQALLQEMDEFDGVLVGRPTQS
ncbi:DDE superfamily endonuclease [Ceratobasidium sp. AG-Ba]|nr:DDE superfamily endonuclease [Ceratobasidium sp. AG-Ba]